MSRFRKPSHARVLASAVSTGLTEAGVVEVVAGTNRDGAGLVAHIALVPSEQARVVSVSLCETTTGRHLWSANRRVTYGLSQSLESGVLAQLVNQTVDVAVLQLHALASPQEPRLAFGLATEAVYRMYRLEASDIADAKTLLIEAQALSPRGLYLAWHAYLQTFLLGESRAASRDDIERRARELATRALRLERQNSMVAALCSHVFAFVLQDYLTAHELARRSLELNAMNPLGRVFLGRAKSYLGQVEEGYRLAEAARQSVDIAPYRTTVELLTGVTAAVSGRFDEAIRLAELLRALDPNYRVPLRYLFALYLKGGRVEEARELSAYLRMKEPEFSIRLLKEQWYPIDGLRRSGLLTNLPEDEL